MDFDGRTVVLKALVGSHNYNLNGKTSDEDYKYFVTPTFDDLYYGNMFSTAKQSPNLDYDVHDIRQLGALLWKANVNFVEVLFSRNIYVGAGLNWLLENKEPLAAMNLPYLFKATLGMHFQKMKDLRKGTAKTDTLVEQFGYDTKQATHAMRCLLMLERISSGMSMEEALWFEFGSGYRDFLLDIKSGGFTEAEFLSVVERWKSAKLGKAEEWFMAQTPNTQLRDELDKLIKNFIKQEL